MAFGCGSVALHYTWRVPFIWLHSHIHVTTKSAHFANIRMNQVNLLTPLNSKTVQNISDVVDYMVCKMVRYVVKRNGGIGERIEKQKKDGDF